MRFAAVSAAISLDLPQLCRHTPYLSEGPWESAGCDVEGLIDPDTANDAWVRLVVIELVDRADDPATKRVLGSA